MFIIKERLKPLLNICCVILNMLIFIFIKSKKNLNIKIYKNYAKIYNSKNNED